MFFEFVFLSYMEIEINDVTMLVVNGKVCRIQCFRIMSEQGGEKQWMIHNW